MPFLSVSTKSTTEVDLIRPIHKYVQRTYGDHMSNKIAAPLQQLQEMRVATQSQIRNKTLAAANQVAKYHDTLYMLESRVSMTETEARIDFKWTDISGKHKKLRNSAFERGNLIYCYAAIHSQIAETADVQNATDLKQAVLSLKLAAGAFDYLSSNTAMLGSTASEQDLLVAFSSVMLAQSQECVFIKAEQGRMPSALIAKVASKTRESYEDALGKCTTSSTKHHVPRSWISTLEGKSQLFNALSQYYQSKACQESSQFGERLARLSIAFDLIKIAAKTPAGASKQYLVEQIKRERDSAQKDNDLIYHEHVPNSRELAGVPAEGAVGRTELPIPLLKGEVKDLFSALLSLGMVQVKDRAKVIHHTLISAETHRLREATSALNAIMVSLNLPAAIQSKVSGTSHSALLENAAKIRKQGGVEALREQVYSLPGSAERNRDILKHQQETLDDEEKTDTNLRAQFKERWIRQPSSKLNEQWRTDVKKMLEFLVETEKTDKMLASRFEEQAQSFELLSQPDDSILAAITAASGDSTSSPTSENESLRTELANLCSSVETLKVDRSSLSDQIDTSTLKDDMVMKLTEVYDKASGAEITDQQIMDVLNENFESIRTCVRASVQQQEDLLANIQTKYEAYFGHRPSQGSATSLATSLGVAADAYFALEKDLREGMMFYAELTERSLKTQEKIDDFCCARNTEKTEHLADITENLSRVTVGDGPNPTPSYAVTTAAPSRPPPTYATAMPTQPAATLVPARPNAASAPIPGGVGPGAPMQPMMPGGVGAGAPMQPMMPGYAPPYGQPYANPYGPPAPYYPSYGMQGYPQGMMMPMYPYPAYPTMPSQLPPGFPGQQMGQPGPQQPQPPAPPQS